MTAYSVGRDFVGTGRVAVANDDRGVSKALGIITALIPGEAIAAYLAMISAIAALQNQPDIQLQLNFWLALSFGIVATIVLAVVGAAPQIRSSKGSERAKAVGGALLYGVGLSALFIVYVSAMPENPIEQLWKIPSAWGGIVAVGITVLWGLAKLLIDSLKKP